MAATMKGRSIRRPAATATIYARVDPDTHAKAHAAAAALGISVAAYVERLLARDEVDETGRPVWWPPAEFNGQGELPLPQMQMTA